MESAFMNWIRGTRLKSFAGIDSENVETKHSKDYTYVEFKASKLLIEDREGTLKEATKAKRGQEIHLVLACGAIRPVRYKILVEPTPELINLFSYLNYQRLVEEGDNGEVTISGKLRQDLDMESLGFIARLYLLS